MKKNYNTLQKIVNLKTLFVLILLLFSANEIHSQVTVPFTTSTTWTCPINVTSIQVTAYGGGGGGGRGGSASRNGGGGGGGGAYSENLSVPVTPGMTYTITIGASGVAGTAALPNGGNGGQTTATFNSSTTVTANGGFGGLGFVNLATGGAGGTGGTRSGGAGGTGATSGSGGGGGCAGTTANGGVGGAGGTTTAGTAGGGNAGAGGAAKTNISAAGNAGANYGGGGSGGTNANNGGAGAGGYMTIRYTISNDICSNAQIITSNTSCTNTTGSTLGATLDSGAGVCTATGTANSVWYQFQAVATTHVVTVKGNTGFDPVINVITACGSGTAPTGASCINSTNDAGTETLTLTGLTIGTFYKIQVHDSQGDLMNNGFTICVTHIAPPTITNLLTASSGCVGSNITITGTNLSGATAANVRIGGTAVSSIISNNGTTLVAVIGTGTTGTVSVTTAGGTATSLGTFTVNPLPTATWASAATSVCQSAGAQTTTLAYTAVTNSPTSYSISWNASPANSFAAVTNQTTTFSAPGTITINVPAGTNAGTYTGTITVRNANGCVSSAVQTFTVTVSTAINTLATAPSPATAATGICYSGAGAVTSISWATAVGATSYDVYFGAGSLPGSVTSNVLAPTLSYTTGTLLASTTYYWKIVPKNSCGATTGTPTTWTFTTTSAPCYCTPTGNLDCSTSNDNIANVTINTLNNNSNCSAGGYTNYPATGTQTTSLTRGNTYNLSIRTGTGNKKHGLAVWIDFNQNFSFDDAGEYFFIGNGINANTTNTIAIPIPAGAVLGNTRMRVRYSRQTNVSSTSSCTMGGNRGETEDYTLTIIDPIACVTPTAQATNLILTPNSTTITGNFTAANPVPNNYLVVISTSSTPPSPGPNNTTSYAIGATVTAGYTVVDNDANTTFVTSTALSATTTYYFYIYSFNSACSGGPRYNLISPLSGSTTTLSSAYCIPSVSNTYETDTYFSEVSFIGTLNDFTNYSTYSSSPIGYQDFTGLTNIASQAQGEGVNVSITTPYLSYVKAWVDWNRDGAFADPGERVYSTGTTSIFSTTFGFVIPSATPVGNYRIRLRLNENTGSDTFNSCGNIANWGETEDYLFTVVSSCSATIATVTDGKTCGSGTVVLGATTASVGVTAYRWYTTPTGSTLVGTTSTGTWTTPSITTTTTYYVTVFNGCESLVRTPVVAYINPLPNLTYSPTNPTVCGEDVILDLSVTGDKEEVYLINEKFNSGTGTFTNTNILTSASDALTQWQNKTSTFVPAQAVWFPAISSGLNNTFAYTTSDISATTVHNQLASAAVNTTNFTNLTLSLKMYYSHYQPDGVSGANDYVTIDVSTDGGATWPASGEIKRYIEDVGIGTRFETQTFDLSAYINKSNLKIRVRYYAYWSDGVAVDDIKLYGDRPITTAFSWTSSTTIDAYTNIACTPADAYIPGTPALNVYVKPSLTQLELSSYSFTANATLANGCSTSQIITVTNNSKIWNGTDSYWDDDENWMPLGKPTASNCIIIPDTTFDPIISGTSYDAFGKNITVKNGGNLTVNSNNNITITDAVTVKTGGLFDIQNSASLIQTNDASINNGSIKMTRTSRPMTRWAYVYWGSPVVENVFSQIPSQFDLKYRWQSGTSTGAWLGLSSTTQGQGFIARVRNIAPFNTGTGTIDFPYTGTPGNGVVTVPVDSFNTDITLAGNTMLLANPYPSAIDAKKFLEYGILPISLPENNSELGGTLFFWTSFTLYNGTGPYVVTDYASWNLSGGVGTKASADISGTDNLKPNGKIAAGQGFFSQVFADGNITFNNSMRVPDFNSQFFKSGNSTTSDSENNRIWLNLYSNTTFKQMLVNYKAEATNGYDRLYDGNSFTNNEVNLYSILDDRNLVIQGRGLPFDENDIVPLGYKITNQGVYNIAIDELDGLFLGEQNVYLRDKFLSIDHDLKDSPYSFTTAAGTFNNRFEIVYVSNALGTNNPSEINTFASIFNNVIKIESSEFMKEITLYDITGKLINIYSLTESKKQFSDVFNYPNGVYIAKITLDNDVVVTKKLIH